MPGVKDAEGINTVMICYVCLYARSTGILEFSEKVFSFGIPDAVSFLY